MPVDGFSFVEPDGMLGVGIDCHDNNDNNDIRSLEELYEDLEILNISNDSISFILQDIKNAYKNFKDFSKIFANVSKDKITSLSKEYKACNQAELRVQKTPEELLALIDQGVSLEYGYHARDAQILSLIAMLMTSSQGQGKAGVLLQIATGEGKSLISAMFAICKVFQGHYVDITTSSPLLAKREADEKSSFYSMFDITVAHNCYKQHRGFKECYAANVVYGDVSHFQYDHLYNDYEMLGTKGARGYDVIVADEVDSMFIDESAKIAMLSSGIPGSEYLEILKIAMWNRLVMFNSRIKFLEDKVTFIVKEDFNPNLEEELLEDDYVVIKDIREFKKIELREYLDELLNEQNNSLPPLPKYMREFAQLQREDWITSALSAEAMKENKHYVLLKQNYKTIIAPVDYLNTGVTQVTTSWSSGLHQFLQIKHCLKIIPEDLISKFISNVAFFKKYEKGLFGMTGTFGSGDSCNFLKSQYGVNLLLMPTFKAKRFTEIEGIIRPDRSDWLDAVFSSINELVKSDRAVLFIAGSIADANQVHRLLQSENFPSDKIRLYIRSDDSQFSSNMLRPLSKGEIIIATNLAGRGTDIETTDEVEKAGGLHVIVGYLPSNLRVEKQAFGRTARCGHKGTAQLIINYDSLSEDLQVHAENIGKLKAARDILESKRLEDVAAVSVPNLRLKDDLFNRFSNLIKPWKKVKDNQYLVGQIEERWAMFLKENIKSPKDGKGLIDYSLALESFAKFENEINYRYKTDSPAYTNPFYPTMIGLNKMYVDYNLAIGIFDKAIPLDYDFTFAAYYYKAYSIIRKANDEYCRTKKMISGEYLSNAAAALNGAVGVIQNTLKPNLETMKVLIHQVGDNELLGQINKKTEILNSNLKNIENIFKAIQSCNAKKERIIIGSTMMLKDSLPPEYEDEIRDFGVVGFHYSFDVVKVSYPKDWWGVITMAILGICQIALGVIFSAIMPVPMLTSVLMSGIKDVMQGINIAKGKAVFDLAAYFTEKAINFAISLVCTGLDKLHQSLQGVQTGTEVAKEGAKEVTKSALRQSIESVAMQFAVTEAIDYVSDRVVDKFDIEDEAENKIKKFLRKAETIAKLREIIEYTLRSGEKSGINEIYSSITQSFKGKQSILSRVAMGTANQMASRNAGTYAVLKISEISYQANEASEVLDDVISDITSKISEVYARIPDLKDILGRSMGRSLTEKEMEVLKQFGVVKSNERKLHNIKVLTSEEFIDAWQKIGSSIIDIRKIQNYNSRVSEEIIAREIEDSKSRIESTYISYVSGVIGGMIKGCAQQIAAPAISAVTEKLAEIASKYRKANKQDEKEFDPKKANHSANGSKETKSEQPYTKAAKTDRKMSPEEKDAFDAKNKAGKGKDNASAKSASSNPKSSAKSSAEGASSNPKSGAKSSAEGASSNPKSGAKSSAEGASSNPKSSAKSSAEGASSKKASSEKAKGPENRQSKMPDSVNFAEACAELRRKEAASTEAEKPSVSASDKQPDRSTLKLDPKDPNYYLMMASGMTPEMMENFKSVASDVAALRRGGVKVMKAAADASVSARDGYRAFAADHPVATSVLETGAPVLVGGAVGGILGGPPGAAAGIIIGLKGMVTGEAINLAAGDQIGKVMGAAHDGLARGFARAGDLNSNQASALAGATMFGAGLFMDVKTGFAAGNVSSKLPHKTGQPGATSVFSKKSVDDFGIGLKPKNPVVESSSSSFYSAKEKIVQDPLIAKRYLKQMNDITNMNIDSVQIAHLNKVLKQQEFVKLDTAAQMAHRNEFRSVKNNLIAEWESKTGKVWPRYESDIFDWRTQKQIKKAGDRYDAHHIIPVNHGGPNTWYNIHPADLDSHKKIHGQDSIARNIFYSK